MYWFRLKPACGAGYRSFVCKNNKWKNTKSEGKFLYPVKALSSVFRGKFCDYLIGLHNKGELELDTAFGPNRKYLHPFYKNKWAVYAKLPMYNSKQVLDYLSRYSHRAAISNHRIKGIDDGNVYFSWLNYKNSRIGVMPLSFFEFLRRLSMHILPSGFMKVRHYGIFSSCKKGSCLAIIREALDAVAPLSKKGIPWQELFVLLFGHPSINVLNANVAPCGVLPLLDHLSGEVLMLYPHKQPNQSLCNKCLHRHNGKGSSCCQQNRAKPTVN